MKAFDICYLNDVTGSKTTELIDIYNKRVQNMKFLWNGIVCVGKERIYIKCYDPVISEKIESFFATTQKGTYDNQPLKLNIIIDNIENFISDTNLDLDNITYVYFVDNKTTNCPNIILKRETLFFRKDHEFFLILNNKNDIDYRCIGDNHILTPLLNYIVWDTTTMVVHGAVIGTKEYGVMISGRSGAGKSTLSASCAKKGLFFIGDDRIALHIENGICYANPIYRTLTLAKHINFCNVRKTLKNVDKTKDIMVLDYKFPTNIPIRSIITTDIGPKPGLQFTDQHKIIQDMLSELFWLARPIIPLIHILSIKQIIKHIPCLKLVLNKHIEDNVNIIYHLVNKRGDISCI